MKSTARKNNTNLISDGHFQALIENAHDGIVVYDLTGRIKYASKSVKKVLGFTAKEVIGKFGTQFVHPDDIEYSAKSFFTLTKKPRKTVTLFQRIRHRNGTYIWAEARLTNFNHLPKIQGIVSNFRDITEQKLAEEKSRKTTQLLESITQNLSEGIFMGILNSKFLYVNEAFLRLTGYNSITEVQKLKFSDFYQDKAQRLQIVKTLTKSSRVKGVQAAFKRKNGETFLGEINLTLLKKEGKSDYFVGSIRDITREKIAEREKSEAKIFLDNIINTVAAPIFVKDSQHRWVLVNQEFCSLIGHSREELIGHSDGEFWSPEEAKVFIKIDNEVLRKGRTIVNEEQVTSPDGKVHDLLTIKSRYKNEDGKKFIIGFITEITEVKKAQEKIQSLHSNLEAVMESANESIFAVDQKLNYTAFNQHHKKIMKQLYGADIKVGSNKIQYLQKSKDAPWVKAELLKALKGNHYYSEHEIDYPGYAGYIQTTYNPIKDERQKVKGVAVFVQDITQRKQFERIVQSINANLTAVMESTADRILAVDRNYRYITFNQSHADSILRQFGTTIKAGDSLLAGLPKSIARIVKRENEKAFEGKRFKSQLQLPDKTFLETSYNPIHSDQGKITGSALFVRDVTESRRIEDKLKALNEELTHQNLQLASQEVELKNALNELSERNFELDQLMYKTSHDLRSPLCSITGLLNLANLDTDPNNHGLYLEKIRDRIAKLDDFINSMLNYARVNRAEVEMIPVNLEDVARNSIKELEYLENFDKVKTELTITNAGVFKTDKLRINIIFSNIISNAYKYYNPTRDSHLKIRIHTTPKHAKLEFSDNGIGIKPEHMDKIFNMFYRATERSQGSGLGMYIVKQAVERLNGTISLHSDYGVGTLIKITLPNGNSI